MTPPYAILTIAVNGGAPQTGAIIVAFSDVLRFRSEHTATVKSFKFEIYEYPDGFTCPAGWSEDAAGVYFYNGATPPDVTLPADTSLWGKFLPRLTINNGNPEASGLPASQFKDEASVFQIVEPDAGVPDVAYLESAQFDTQRKYVGGLKGALRLLAIGLGAGFGSGSLADHSVTHVKYQTIATDRLLGRDAGGTGDVGEIAVTNGLGFTGSNSIGIEAAGVTYARIQNVSAQGRLLGRGGASGVGSTEELTVGGGLEFNATQVRRSALTGDVTAAAGSNSTSIATNAVTLSMMAQVATARFLGRVTASTGNVESLTGTQATTLLDVFTSSLKGLVPLSGGGTTNFLRADGSWAAPGGGFTSPASPGDNGKLTYGSSGANAWTANITTNGTRVAFGASAATTDGLLGFAHNTILLAGRNQAGDQDVALARWGVGTNDQLYFGSKSADSGKVASMAFGVHTGGSFAWEVNSAAALTATAFGLAIAGAATTGTVIPALTVTDSAHTALTASTERNSVYLNLAQTRQWATGALTTQRVVRIAAPTIAFVGASVLTTAATVAISGAPSAGTNATITNAMALWLESGGIGFGSSAARSGSLRFPNALANLLTVRNAADSANVSILTGLDASNIFRIGDNANLARLFHDVATGGSYEWYINSTTELELTSTALDLKNNGLTNVATINGQTFYFALSGTDLTDANQTITVAGGNRYVLPVSTLSTSRTKTLGVTGSPTVGEIIRIERRDTSANTMVVQDDAATTLYTFPVSQRRAADFRFDGTHFVLSGHVALAA